MKITITKELLMDNNACGDGLEQFEKLYPNGYEAEWTLEEQIKIIKSQVRKYFGWTYRKKLLPMWSMCNTDLCNTDLRGANLCGADLRGADMTKEQREYAKSQGAIVE